MDYYRKELITEILDWYEFYLNYYHLEKKLMNQYYQII